MPHTPNPPADSAGLLRFEAYEQPRLRYALWGTVAAVAVVALGAGLAWNHWQPVAPVAGTAEPGAAPVLDRGVPIEAEVHPLADALVLRNMTSANWQAGQVEVEARGTLYRTTFTSLAAGRDLRLSFAELRSDAGDAFAAAGAPPEKVTIRAGGGVLTKDLVPPPTSAPEVAPTDAAPKFPSGSPDLAP